MNQLNANAVEYIRFSCVSLSPSVALATVHNENLFYCKLFIVVRNKGFDNMLSTKELKKTEYKKGSTTKTKQTKQNSERKREKGRNQTEQIKFHILNQD